VGIGPWNERPPVGLDDFFPTVAQLSNALDLLPLPSLVLASDGSATAVNGGWALLSGVPAEASRGEGWLGALEPLDRGPLRRRLAGAATAGEPGSADYRLAGPDGDQWCRWWWRPSGPGQLVVCVTGLDQPMPADSRPWLHAADGSQWRLVRRGEFVNMTARALRRSRWTGALVAVVTADLNQLGSAAGSDGHAGLMAARRILAAGGPAAAGAIVSRDEFAVLCDDLRDPGEADTVAARMGESVHPPARDAASGPPLRTGVAIASKDDTAETLIARACHAMYSPGPADGTADRTAFPVAPAAALLEVATDLVNRLFRAGLAIASASSLVGGPAGERLEEAVDELDTIINDVRSVVFASRSGSVAPADGDP
jgi:hypothetical protein